MVNVLIKKTTTLLVRMYKSGAVRTTTVPKDVIQFLGGKDKDKVEWLCKNDGTVQFKLKEETNGI